MSFNTLYCFVLKTLGTYAPFWFSVGIFLLLNLVCTYSDRLFFVLYRFNPSLSIVHQLEDESTKRLIYDVAKADKMFGNITTFTSILSLDNSS